MKKKYINAELNVITLTTNVIATSGVLDGSTPGNQRPEGDDDDNLFAPSRYGRYSSDYDLY